MKEWIPEKEFKKADFIFNKKSKISERIEKSNNQNHENQNYESTKKIKPYQFPHISKSSSGNGKIVKPKSTDVTNQEQNNIIIKKSEKDQFKEMLEFFVSSNFENSINILRKWYWEQTENSHKKIYIILRSLNKEVLVQLFSFFTIKERMQFIEIYKKTYKISNTDIIIARKNFIDLLQELS
ncbi:MAG: hypothetical protein KatS3mg129_2255 [Leptospiraceae bacterium]|nr:MAG: hypothetical protein KatS3mg129_2255 [Leptospiraceae bacterium]